MYESIEEALEELEKLLEYVVVDPLPSHSSQTKSTVRVNDSTSQ